MERLFCFPYAGVGASAFRGWPEQIGNNVEVCCIELPGREGRIRERPLKSLDELVPLIAENIEKFSDLPYAFYGHSFGGTLAFETARLLRRNEARLPIHLFVSGSPAPHIPLPYSRMSRLGVAEFLAEVQKRYGGIPEAILLDREVLGLLLPALQADIAALEDYRYRDEPPLECPITALGGTGDRMVPEESVAAWRRQTCGEFYFETLAGDHFF